MYDEKAKARMVKYMQSKRIYAVQKRITAAEPAVRNKRLMERLCRRLRNERDRADHETDREGYERTQLVRRCRLQIEIMGLEAPKIIRARIIIAILCGFFLHIGLSLFNYSSVLGLEAPFLRLTKKLFTLYHIHRKLLRGSDSIVG